MDLVTVLFNFFPNFIYILTEFQQVWSQLVNNKKYPILYFLHVNINLLLSPYSTGCLEIQYWGCFQPWIVPWILQAWASEHLVIVPLTRETLSVLVFRLRGSVTWMECWEQRNPGRGWGIAGLGLFSLGIPQSDSFYLYHLPALRTHTALSPFMYFSMLTGWVVPPQNLHVEVLTSSTWEWLYLETEPLG